MTGRIEIRDLRVTGVHGVLEEERTRPQPFSVDLDVWLDVGPAAASDALSDTADYGALVEAAARKVTTSSFQLLEALAAGVAGAVLEVDARVRRVAACVRKLRPPLARDLASAGVRVVVERTAGRAARRAFIGLGTNLGDRWGELAGAVSALAAGGDVAAVSPVYETEPVGGPAGQPAYLNAVVELRTADGPRALLERCRALEERAARVRTVRDGPRTLDADVLLVGDERVSQDDLCVPHPRMWERRFVLAPLADVAPDLVGPDVLAAASGAVRRVGTLTWTSPDR